MSSRSKTTKLDYLVCFKGHIVLNGRSNGDKMLKVMDMNTGEVADLKFDEDCFDVFAKRNKVFETTQFRFGYSSLITPSSTFEYDMEKGVKVLLHEKEAPNYDRSLYATKRTFCTARDGVKACPVPIRRWLSISACTYAPPVHVTRGAGHVNRYRFPWCSARTARGRLRSAHAR